MENPNEDQQEFVNQVYDYAANLLFNEKRSAAETIDALIEQGLNEESASIVVSNLEKQIKDVKKEGANKDMLHGALWCIGGIAATAADLGFIFWGAIVFGAVQFFKGVANS
jgi:alcohol dehydrogenase class IV